MRKTFTPRYDNDYVQKWYLTEALKDVPFAYELITDRGWKVKKYNDGTFEAWYPFTNTNTTTCNNVYATNALYTSPSITIIGPAITKKILYYNVDASFTTINSWATDWIPANTNNLRYQIISRDNITTATTYRQSAYMFGTWK